MFNLKKNFGIGIFLFVCSGVLLTLAGMISPIIHKWDGVATAIPFVASEKAVGQAHPITLFIVDVLLWALVLYVAIALLRGVGLWVARDVERARRITRFMKLLRIGKMEFGSFFWKLLIGFFILADALEGLQRVRTREFYGKRGWGLITKVQRVHDLDTGEAHYEFIVYTGDFPAFFLGRWGWYEAENCELIVGTVSDIAKTFGTVGLAAPSDLRVKKFSPEDLEHIVQNLRERAALLVAAGLIDPDRPIVDSFSNELSK